MSDSMFWHLTWRGRLSATYYALRRLFIAAAGSGRRCGMGSTVDPMVWCPRRAEDDGSALWCKRHDQDNDE